MTRRDEYGRFTFRGDVEITNPNPDGKCLCGCGRTTTIASRNRYRLGHVRGCHTPYWPGHGRRLPDPNPAGLCMCGCGGFTTLDPSGRHSLYLTAHQFRLKSYWTVDADTGCWVWTAALTDCGYGVINRGGRTHKAHRFIYEQVVGPIPEGMTLDHLCLNHACVNPTHLEPVTRSENSRRQWQRVREGDAA